MHAIQLMQVKITTGSIAALKRLNADRLGAPRFFGVPFCMKRHKLYKEEGLTWNSKQTLRLRKAVR